MMLRNPMRGNPQRGAPQAAPSMTKSLPAPTRGWIENENLSVNRGLGAVVLENCVPLTDTVRVRKGSLRVDDIGEGVEGLLPYQAGAVEKFFAASADSIYEITDLDPDDTPVALWDQIGGGRYSSVQIDTGGGQFLLAVNGARAMLCYDGTDWFPIADEAINELNYDGAGSAFTVGGTLTGATSGATATIYGVIPSSATAGRLVLGAVTNGPFQDNETITSASGSANVDGTIASLSAVTVTGVDTEDWSHIWIYKNRVWAVEQDTMVAWYLPTDSIGGAATDFNLGGVFQRGGALMFGGTWSSDSGDGMDDRIVFVSTLGEVAVYGGTDPDADDWGIIGRYDIGAPVTTQTMRAGGDLLIATTDGVVPASAIVTKDPAALATAAVTYPIQPAWLRVIRSNTASTPVQMLKWQKESIGIFAYPHRTGSLKETHIVNLTTGAWSKWTGLDMQCLALYRDKPYFGDSDGNIYEIEGYGSDDGNLYVARIGLLPDHLDVPGAIKEMKEAMATFRSLRPFIAKLSCAMNYSKSFPIAPNAYLSTEIDSLWDEGLWDVAKWDDGEDSEQRQTTNTGWRSVSGVGRVASVQVQISCGGARKADAELVQIDVAYLVGQTVV